MKFISKKWTELITSLPGYNPLYQADGCWFDGNEAQLAISFFHECLHHVEGQLAGKPFKLEEWQKAVIANLFGWKRKNEIGMTVRRYREAFLFVPRKNGKTPLVAGIALFILFCDRERGQQNFIAAGDREQAGFLFRQCRGMIEYEPILQSQCRIYGGNASAGQSRSIVRERSNSFLRVISSDADTKHGGTTHLAVIDELHVQPNRGLVDALQTSMASLNRKQPLFITVTTAGYDRQTICYEKYAYACKVRDNQGDPSRPGYCPSFLPVIYETKIDADWTLESTWREANPNLGVSVSLDYLRDECNRAKEVLDYENTFRQLHLNQWTQQAVRWLSVERWNQNIARDNPDDLKNQRCFGGLDLASTEDITSLVLLFPKEDGYVLLPFFWLPGDTITKRSRGAGVPYDVWAQQGYIRRTPGEWCDYTYVESDIMRLAEEYQIQEIAFDPKECSMLSQRLLEQGINMIKFVQSFTNFNEPVKLFEQLINEGRLRHWGHPVMEWMVQNVSLARNVSGQRMPSKVKSGEKIDGVVSAIMALGRAMLQTISAPSVDWI